MTITVSEFTPSGGSGTSLTVTKTLTAGSALVVVGSSLETGSTISVSDGTNTYTERQSVSHASSGIRTRMWTANNVAGGSTTITMSNLAGYLGTLQAFEILGVDVSAYSASDINSQSVTSVYCAQVSGVTVPSGGIAVACLVCDRDITALSMSGYTSGTNVNNGTTFAYARWQVFAGGASGERAAGTLTTNGHTTGVIAVMAAGTVAPVLSSPTASAGSTTATIGATTDTGSGTLYGVVTTGSTKPSVAQIKAGQDSTGSAAVWAGSAAVSSTGAKTLSATGLTALTTYYYWLVQNATAGDSNIVPAVGSSFTTTSGSTVKGRRNLKTTGARMGSRGL